jgi:hypothetical protein
MQDSLRSMNELAEQAEAKRTEIAQAQIIHISEHLLRDAAGALRSVYSSGLPSSVERQILKHTQSKVSENFRMLGEICKADRDLGELVRRKMGNEAYLFIIHDQAHLSDQLLWTAKDLSKAADGHLGITAEMDPDLFIEHLVSLNELTNYAKRMYARTWELIRNHQLRQENALPAQSTAIGDLAFEVAKVISGRFMFRITSTPQQDKLSTTIDCDGEVAVGAAELSSVLYNNLKNSHKKLFEKMVSAGRKGTLTDYRKSFGALRGEYIASNGPQYAAITCKPITSEYAGLAFSDSGTPLSLDLMLQRIGRQIRHEGINSLQWFSPTTKERFANWSTNPYAFNRLTGDDISSVAFMANITGSQMSSVTSGMGLYGTQHIINDIGGAIIYTTTMDQKPVFLYLLPRKANLRTADAHEVRENIINGILQAA